MAWDKYDTIWFMQFMIVAAIWVTSLACLSFTMFSHWPIITYHILCTVLACYILYSPMAYVNEWKKKHDKILLALNTVFWFWMVYVSIQMMTTIHNGGVLPEHITTHTWTEAWWAPAVYLGAVACPIIYFSVNHRQRKEKKEIERIKARQARRQKEYEERLAMLKLRNELGLH